MSDALRAEAAARDLSQLRAELHRWIRRAREAERINEELMEEHAETLAERDREVARLRSELDRFEKAAAEAPNVTRAA